MKLNQSSLWAKLDRSSGSWHSLIAHSSDVAAVMRVLLDKTIFNQRLAFTIGQETLTDVQKTRFSSYAFIHDFGKANSGFRARINPDAKLIGHVEQGYWLFNKMQGDVTMRAYDALRLEKMENWLKSDASEIFDAICAHHGRPVDLLRAENCRVYWNKNEHFNPIDGLEELGFWFENWFNDAFAEGDEILETPQFIHLFAGALMLADWIGSDTSFFPMSNGDDDVSRFSDSINRSERALRLMGLDVEQKRQHLIKFNPSFQNLFNVERPRQIQEIITQPKSRCLILESETGSGKTEAALWYFVELFKAGKVDGMYFALPTRVAATQIFKRIERLVGAMFPDDLRPSVILAVPGQSRKVDSDVDNCQFSINPQNDVWDTGELASGKYIDWAAEHPKRYLSAQIAVGTIDQAIMSSIKIKHAHLRGSCLSKNLLIIDEAHASDYYQTRLLKNLLHGHAAVGGYSLLLSATLGSQARTGFLSSIRENNSITDSQSLEDAEIYPYPSLSWSDEAGKFHVMPVKSDNTEKSVEITCLEFIRSPQKVAAIAMHAVASGAKVLILKNTVSAAIETQMALEVIGCPTFKLNNVNTLHHSRFSANDRLSLDTEIERTLGKHSCAEPICVVSTQTTEISLDIDVDLLITDLCPVDVLLQRIGRLHRHKKIRPKSYEIPKTIVLLPENGDIISVKGSGFGAVYGNMAALEATKNLCIKNPVWKIPSMNRWLVENATHFDVISKLEQEMCDSDSRWKRAVMKNDGNKCQSGIAAIGASLNRREKFAEFKISKDEMVTTRLGINDIMVSFSSVVGPFGNKIGSLKIPSYFLNYEDYDKEPIIVEHKNTGIKITIGSSILQYDRFGLKKIS